MKTIVSFYHISGLDRNEATSGEDARAGRSPDLLRRGPGRLRRGKLGREERGADVGRVGRGRLRLVHQDVKLLGRKHWSPQNAQRCG